MKLHKVLLVFLLAGAVSSLRPLSAQPGNSYGYPDDRGHADDRFGYGSPQGEVGFFYEELSPYGDWIQTYEYGWCWMPRNVGIGWRPYTMGRWIPSEHGWFWVSHEPFGWATYHYGRWAFHPRYGWVWTPGRTWGPAWVSWQHGEGYIGWAPLPPEAGFQLGVGLRLGGLDLSVLVRPHAYTFVDERRFLDDRLDRYAVPSSRNVSIIPRTRNVTRYTTRNNVVINTGIEIDRVERVVGRRLKRWRVAESQTHKNVRVGENEVTIYRPPRQRLESVKIDDRQPRRRRAEPPPKVQREPAPRADRARPVRPPDGVAPRVRQVVPSERVERKQQEDKKRLAEFERAQRQRLEALQRAEREKRARQADAEAIARRQRAEKKALEEQLQRTREQLSAKREVQRRAERVTPPAKQRAEDRADKKAADRRGKEKPPKRPPGKPPLR